MELLLRVTPRVKLKKVLIKKSRRRNKVRKSNERRRRENVWNGND